MFVAFMVHLEYNGVPLNLDIIEVAKVSIDLLRHMGECGGSI